MATATSSRRRFNEEEKDFLIAFSDQKDLTWVVKEFRIQFDRDIEPIDVVQQRRNLRKKANRNSNGQISQNGQGRNPPPRIKMRRRNHFSIR